MLIPHGVDGNNESESRKNEDAQFEVGDGWSFNCEIVFFEEGLLVLGEGLTHMDDINVYDIIMVDYLRESTIISHFSQLIFSSFLI